MTTAKKVAGRDILTRPTRQRMEVYVEDWESTAIIQKLTHAQVIAIQTLAQKAVDVAAKKVRDASQLTRFNFAMIQESWINEDGSPVLSNSEEDYQLMMSHPNTAIKALVQAISDFNEMNDDAQENAKKNSSASRNGDYGTS